VSYKKFILAVDEEEMASLGRILYARDRGRNPKPRDVDSMISVLRYALAVLSNQTDVTFVSKRWRPVTDTCRPDHYETVLVGFACSNDPVWLGYIGDGVWREVGGEAIDPAPTHWMHLPEPPAIHPPARRRNRKPLNLR